ncbi:MAG: hypothetical protein A2021_01725 [Elusimicrobia bacterium GWF2_52_66]|nr:MAG: hypothetical protein A2021_01725 [Elusimicrobia bacterium GWF2_52_66]
MRNPPLFAAYRLPLIFFVVLFSTLCPIPSTLLFAQAVPAAAPDSMNISIMEKQETLKARVENKIKTEILDPILGPEKSFVFADVELEVVSKKSEENREGMGVIQKYKEQGTPPGGADTDFILPGIPKPKSVTGASNARPAAAQGQQTQQQKGLQQVRYGLETDVSRFQLTVIHDVTVSSESLRTARARIEDFLLPYKIHGRDAATVIFQPTRFKSYNILDDLKRPGVYLPLLYALLFLLMLLFLFGPLWGFFRKYVRALMAKPGAEVNIDQKMEEGGGDGGKGEGIEEGHQQIDMNFKQKGEEEEDESMKKFEPFTYINEENLKRLIYLFLLKKEDPWVIAVVLNYMKPELARQALSMLSVEIQSKVALESLTVRQATREQIEAIDKEIKESIDFVMGGIERLTKMLEEADVTIKKNILDYLKTQKPDIYEKIKKIILMFEDLISFPDKDLQTIIRSVSNEDIAKAVYKGDPQLVNKFFANMSPGAVNAIKEILEYSGEISVPQVDEAQMKILDSIKSLSAEGKINSRQQNNQEIYIINSGELSSGDQRRQKLQSIAPDVMEARPPQGQAPAPADAAQAAQYLSAGVEFYNQGKLAESLQYLEYAATLNALDAQTWQYLGTVYYALNRTDEAVQAYERYASLSNDPAVNEWLAGFKQQAGK